MGAKSRVCHPSAAVTTLSPRQGIHTAVPCTSSACCLSIPFPVPRPEPPCPPRAPGDRAEAPWGPAATSVEGQPGCAPQMGLPALGLPGRERCSQWHSPPSQGQEGEGDPEG